MFSILAVCTGNTCRSPIAEHLLRTRSDPRRVRVSSAGTRARDGAAMTAEARRVAERLGVDADLAAAHATRRLTTTLLDGADLVLAMARDHRGRATELAPQTAGVTFTVREFARVARSMSDAEIVGAATQGAQGTDDGAASRLRSVVALVAARRDAAPRANDPSDDDVADPFGLTAAAYALSGAHLADAVDQVVRVLALAAAPTAR